MGRAMLDLRGSRCWSYNQVLEEHLGQPGLLLFGAQRPGASGPPSPWSVQDAHSTRLCSPNSPQPPTAACQPTRWSASRMSWAASQSTPSPATTPPSAPSPRCGRAAAARPGWRWGARRLPGGPAAGAAPWRDACCLCWSRRGRSLLPCSSASPLHKATNLPHTHIQPSCTQTPSPSHIPFPP